MNHCRIVTVDADENISLVEYAQNSATAKVVAQREANARGEVVYWGPVGSPYLTAVRPEEVSAVA